MVYIECLIMEVNVNKDINMGVEWLAGDNFDDNKSTYLGGFGGGASGGDDNYLLVPGRQ